MHFFFGFLGDLWKLLKARYFSKLTDRFQLSLHLRVRCGGAILFYQNNNPGRGRSDLEIVISHVRFLDKWNHKTIVRLPIALEEIY